MGAFLGKPSPPRCLFLHPHIPEVWIEHVKRSSLDVLAHGNEAGRVTIVDIGDALPEEPLDVLPEPIALFKLPLDLHRVHQMHKVGITVPSPESRVAAEPGME